MYICIFVYTCICVYVYMCICMYVYMCICVYVYMYICVYVYILYVYMCICVYVYMYICIYVYMYICICVYVYIRPPFARSNRDAGGALKYQIHISIHIRLRIHTAPTAEAVTRRSASGARLT